MTIATQRTQPGINVGSRVVVERGHGGTQWVGTIEALKHPADIPGFTVYLVRDPRGMVWTVDMDHIIREVRS